MNRTNLVLCCALAVLASVLPLASPVHAVATAVVYDSLSGYSPTYTPVPPPSWLNGNLEQGILISRSNVQKRLTKAEYLLRNSNSVPSTISTTVRFYSDQNGLPTTLLATASSVVNVTPLSVEKATVDLPDLLLPVDPIWITWSFGGGSSSVILGATTTVGDDFGKRAYWEHGDLITDNAFDRHGVPALRLTGVPEPSAAALGCVALASLALGRACRSLPTRLGGG